MAEPSQTTNLNIPRALGADLVSRASINNAIDKIDAVVLPIAHESSKAHFAMWKANQAYKKQDVVRTPTCPNWGIYLCSVAGTSAATEPQGYGEGDVIVDGTCTWILTLIGGGGIKKHQDLIGRNMTNQHTIAAITDLQDALDGKVDKIAGKDLSANDYVDADKAKVDYLTVTAATNLDDIRNDSHTHPNNAELDKIGEKNGKLMYDQKPLIGGADTWKTNYGYETGELIVIDGLLYRCIVAHTSATFAVDSVNWEQLTIGYIPPWQASITYVQFQVITNSGRLMCCTMAHKSRIAFDAKEAIYWEVIAQIKITFNDWIPQISYMEKEIVIYQNKIYRCNRAHASGTTFKGVFWDLLSSANTDKLKQYEMKNVSAPQSIELAIEYTTAFCLPMINVLKYNPSSGAQDQLLAIESFSSDDASDFIVDGLSAELSNNYIFDGVMKINTAYQAEVGAEQKLGQDTICETEYIDFSAYKKIENIGGGFL